DLAALAGAVERCLAAYVLLRGAVLEVALGEAKAQPVLGLPAHEVGCDLGVVALRVVDGELEMLLDGPAVAGLAFLDRHLAVDPDDAAVWLGRAQRYRI